ncbi:MAG: phage major capsid protein, partial [Candidatus Thorarchaeota archaeon]
MGINKFDPDKAFGNKYEHFRDTWLNNGFNVPTQAKVEFVDLMATPNATIWMPKVIEEIVREPVEPMLIIPSLLDRIAYTPAARITFPAMGAMVAFDLAEGQSYPEQSLNVAPGSITINVGKTGIMFKITEEMQKYSQFDIMNMHIRAGRRGLDRHKEKKGFDFVSGMGVTLFDNKTPLSSVYGTCTGRSMTGSGNGSCRVEDLLKAYSHIMMQGYTPDTILLHPLAWSMWMADPLLQTIAKNTGNIQW